MAIDEMTHSIIFMWQSIYFVVSLDSENANWQQGENFGFNKKKQ